MKFSLACDTMATADIRSAIAFMYENYHQQTKQKDNNKKGPNIIKYLPHPRNAENSTENETECENERTVHMMLPSHGSRFVLFAYTHSSG